MIRYVLDWIYLQCVMAYLLTGIPQYLEYKRRSTMAKTEFTCTECGCVRPDGDLCVRLGHDGWLCTECAEEYDRTLPVEVEEQLSIMAAENGCDREAEWAVNEVARSTTTVSGRRERQLRLSAS
jgi:hypothetical protein